MPRGSSGAAWFEEAFGVPEATYAEMRKAFHAEKSASGEWLLRSPSGRALHVGRFETPSVTQLHTQLQAAGPPLADLGGLKFTNIVGCVRSLHSDPKNAGAVFQVASQFNCLEMTGPGVRPEDGVTRYAADATQGPACALACPAATVFRNYFVNGTGQGGGRQLDTFGEVGRVLDNRRHNYWAITNGYCLPKDPNAFCTLADKLRADPAMARTVAQHVQVGVHWDTEVSGKEHRVCQVFCSALPVAYGKAMPIGAWAPLAVCTLDGAYEGTLAVGALLAAQRRQRVPVFVTALGGGAFGNLQPWIVQALQRALLKFQDHPLDVALLHYFASSSPAYTALEKLLP